MGTPPPLLATPQRCWSCPASTSLPPSLSPLPTRSLGVPPVSLGIEVPHQHLAGALVVGRRELHVLPCCHLDSVLIFQVFLLGESVCWHEGVEYWFKALFLPSH